MPLSVTPQELVIVIAAQNHSPAVVNLEFLKYSGIVPMSWELTREPVYTPQVIQLVFQNGVVITAQPSRVLFAEMIENKAIDEIVIPELARKYVQSLPNMEYEALGFNPTGHVAVGEAEATKQYLNQTLLSPGPWHTIGEAPMRARLQFAYTLEHSTMNLTVSEAGLRQEDETVQPIVVFGSNFNYPLNGSSAAERLSSLLQALDRWQADFKLFEDVVNQKFLSSLNSQPALLPVFA